MNKKINSDFNSLHFGYKYKQQSNMQQNNKIKRYLTHLDGFKLCSYLNYNH